MRKFSKTPQEAPVSAGAAAVAADVNVGAKKQKRQAPFHVVKKDQPGMVYRFFVRAVAVGVSLLVILLFVQGITGYSFASIWQYMVNGAFGTEYSQNRWLRDMCALLLIAVALAPVFKMKFWNIGAQGQVLMGAVLTATFMYFYADSMSYSANMLVFLIMSVLAGGIWALIPAFFKVKLKANETLFTLMMNYIAIQLTLCCVDKWKGNQVGLGLFNTGTQAGYMEEMFANPYGAVILIAVVAVIAMWIYLNKTKQGYEITVVGDSPNTAKYAGMNTAKIVMRTAFISGAICGVVGMLYVSCINHTLSSGIGGNYGFTAIIVAWAAKFNPVVMALISMAIVFFERGAAAINDTSSTLNNYTSYVIVAIFLFFLIGCEFFVNYKIVPGEKVSEAYHKFRAKLEQKVPWLVHGCAWCAAALHKASTAVEKFFTTAENKVKVVAGKLCRGALDKTVEAVEQCAFRIVLRGDKYKTVVYEKEEHAPSSPTAAEDASADAPEKAVCEGEKEGECTNVD